MSSNKGQKEENAFRGFAETSRPQADAAITTASKPDEFEERRRKRALAIDRWESGEAGPQDVRNMPYNDVNIGLFNDAMKVHDADRAGRGVGSMAGNANPNFQAALNKESEMERHKLASGALEANVEGTLAANREEMYGLADRSNARNLNIAGMREGRYQGDQNRYTQLMMREKKPNFFQQLASSFGGQLGASAATALI